MGPRSSGDKIQMPERGLEDGKVLPTDPGDREWLPLRRRHCLALWGVEFHAAPRRLPLSKISARPEGPAEKLESLVARSLAFAPLSTRRRNN